MKKLFIGLSMFSLVFYKLANEPTYGTFTIIRDASTLSRGTLPNARLDPSSVTLQGNDFNYSTAISTISQYLSGGAVSVYSAGIAQGNATTIDFTNSVSATCSGSTCTATVAAPPSTSKYAYLSVGTNTANGANVIGTTADIFAIAISSLGGQASSGTIYVQPGSYYFTGKMTSVPAGVELVFDKGAWIRSDEGTRYGSIFAVSGTITGANMHITTSIIVAGNHQALYEMWGNGLVRGGEIKLNLHTVNPSGGGSTTLIGHFGPLSKNAMIKDVFVSSWGVAVQANATSTSLFKIDGSTGGRMMNIVVSNGQVASTSMDLSIFAINNGCDGFEIDGGSFEGNQRTLIWLNDSAGAGLLRGFRWKNTRLNQHIAPSVAGTIAVNMPAAMIISSGNYFSNLDVFYDVTTGNETIEFNVAAAYSDWGVFGLNVFHNAAGNTGGGFTVGSGLQKAIFIGNHIIGTNACMADSGTSTRWTGSLNYCQGNAQ